MTRRISKLAISAMIFTGLCTAAFADAISERQEKMKAVGKSIGIVGKMAKGQTAFDSEAALAAFVAMKDAADGFDELFPQGTETGGDTEAAPAIFSDRDGFEKAQADFEADLMAATGAAPTDLAALRSTLGMVGENCGVCHKAYRVKKN